MTSILAATWIGCRRQHRRRTHDLAYMRIEKWKTDADSKRQAQATADSVQRNLTSALPALISNVRSAPQDLGEEFKLYRNLNALYDVFASLTESTGAFGAKSDYDALAKQLDVIDSVRRNLGNALESLTASTQSELAQLRTQVHTLQQAAAAPPSPPKKVIVDDNEPAKKTTHKKKTRPSRRRLPATVRGRARRDRTAETAVRRRRLHQSRSSDGFFAVLV